MGTAMASYPSSTPRSHTILGVAAGVGFPSWAGGGRVGGVLDRQGMRLKKAVAKAGSRGALAGYDLEPMGRPPLSFPEGSHFRITGTRCAHLLEIRPHISRGLGANPISLSLSFSLLL